MFNNVFLKPCCLSDKVENIVERYRSHLAIWRMCIACWILNSTRTHSEYV